MALINKFSGYNPSGDMTFVDKDGKVVRTSLEDYNSRISANIGEAYAFFDCNALKQEIEAELPTIRKLAKTPSKLELSLVEDPEKLGGDKDLIQKAKESGYKYAIKATYHGATNEKTADELADILIHAYQSRLYQEGEDFKGDILYKTLKGYVSRD